jgi:uncharacterized protein YhjY with autotransporter beta-barrel domain/mevalonate kinase
MFDPIAPRAIFRSWQMNNAVLALRPQSAAAPILSNRSFVHRFCGRTALLLLLLGLASPAWAMCVLADSGKIGGFTFPGDNNNFIFSVNEDGVGAPCESAQYRLEENLDTTGDPPGSFITSPLQGTGFLDIGVQGSYSISERGGGEFGFLVYCTSGCADTVNPQFEVLYTVDDLRQTRVFSGDGQVAGTGSPFTSPVQLLTTLNGVGDASAFIDWQILPQGAATFVASGTDTLTAPVDSFGIGSVEILAGPTETSFNVLGCVAKFGCKEAAFFNLSISNQAVIVNTTSSADSPFVNQGYPLTFQVLNNGSPVPPGTPIGFEDDPGCKGQGTGSSLIDGTTGTGGGVAFVFSSPVSGTFCRLVRWDINGDTTPGPGNTIDDVTLPLFIEVNDFYEITAVDPPGGNVVLRPGEPQDLRVEIRANGVLDDTHVLYFNQTAGPAQMNGATLGPVAPSGGTTSTSVNASVIGEYQVRARYTFNNLLDGGAPGLLAASSGDLPVDVLFNITVRNLINAVNDDFSGTPLDGQAGGATPSVHGNDQFNLSTLGASQVVTSILGDGGLTGVNITSGGVINVPAPRAAGSYPVVYQLCDVLEPTNCASATATVVITAPAIVASDDNFVGAPTFSASAGGSTSSVYANDTIGGAPFTASDVTSSILNDGGLVGITINPSSGALDLPAPPLPVGVFVVTYEICDALNPTSCDSAQAQLDIANTVPTFSSTPLTSATEDLAYSYAIATTEPDSGDSVSISSDSTLPGWLSLVDNGDGSATLSGTPLNADVGVTPSIDLRVTDSIGGFSTQSFTITVGNSNDTPQFTSTAPTAASEGVLYSYAITATDEDVGDSLAISPISTLPGWLALVDNGNGSATLSGTPTNADVGSFSIDLQVSDLALASDTQSFTIVVSNVNEAPVFGQPSYSFSVDENAAKGALVGSAVASDPDVGQTLSYAITADSSGGVFAIDSGGQISVAGGSALDFETTASFTLTVQATDNDVSPLSSSVSVQIDLNDLNELPTIIAQARSVDENSPDGTPVGAPLLADDVDAGTNGVLVWSIIGGNTGGAFAVDGSGQLSVASQSAINLANTPFSLQVQVQDGGGLTASATVTVTVGDVNDAPVFGQSSYSFAIDENAANGTPVGATVAVDVDAGQTLSYAIIADSSGGLFAIDGAGQISVVNGAGLDFETAPSFSLTVQATDDDASPLSASAAVQITLNDVNEMPTIAAQARSVDENSPDGTSVGAPLLADDVDAGANGALDWSIVGGNTGGAFAVDSNGQLSVANQTAITVANAPFSLQVQVQDGGGLSASATVTVSVGNINDAPVFGQSSYSFAINENAANASPVGATVAVDVDAGQTLSYAIIADSSGGLFAIDGAGQISVVNGSALDFETAPSFSLTVQATDDDASPLSSSVPVQIDLIDLNELPTIAAQARSVDENSPDGTPVGAALLADDVDAGANGVLDWSIVGGNTGSAFAVDSNGQLSVASQAAITVANAPFSLQVQVQDGGGLSASATVTVAVGNINDAPVFGQSSYSFSINENAASGTPLGSTVATDPDLGQSLSYAITDDSSGGLFAVDGSGQISVVNGSGLDFETASRFTLTVQATDDDVSPLSASVPVQIDLNDLNEVPTITAQTRNVDENSPDGTLAGAPLLADDVDSGANGVLVWSIVGGNTGGAFAVDSGGQLSVASEAAITLTNAPFNLQVQVQDGGGLSASAAVTVSVNDIAMSLLAVSGQGQRALPGATLAESLVVRAENDSNPVSGVVIDFSVSPPGAATVTPASGVTGADGNLSVSAQLNAQAQPGASIEILAVRRDDPDARAVFSVDVTTPITVSTLRLPVDSGDGQSGLVGSTLQPLRVLAEDDGAAVSGVDILWSVSGPASLSAAQSGTDAGGIASIGVTLGGTPGPVTVTAQRADAPLAMVEFTLTALPNPDPALLLVSGNGQSGLLGTRAEAPIVVRLLAGDGSPSAGETIAWDVLSANAMLDATSSVTNAQGEAEIGFVFGDTPGAVQIRAAHAGSGLSVLSLHQANTAAVGAVEGGNQTGVAGQPLPERFVISLAPALRKALGGARVDWQVLSGGGSLESDFTLTDSDGRTSNLLTLGVLGGENIVRAIVPGGQEVLFTAQGGAAPGSLLAVSGDGQTLPTATPSAPLVVQLRDAAGQPVSGATIDWSGENASVDPSSSVTDDQGRAQTVASVLLPGVAGVTASTEVVDTAAVAFSLNGGVANIPSLTPEQEQTSDAVDQLCPALAALPSRSPGQEDLFQRCLELVDNAGTNPDDVQEALDQLPTDIGITLSEVGTTAVVAQNNNFEQRFRQVRTEQPGSSRNQLDIGFWTPDGALPLSFLPAAAGDDAESAEGADLGPDFSRFGFFATGQIGRGKVDQGQQSPEFEFDIGGLTAGVDYRFNDQWVGGLALGYSDNSAELSDDRGELDSRALSLTAYATWYNEQSWYVDGTLLAGRSNNDLLRRIRYSIRALDGSLTQIDQRATASTDGSQLGATFAFGKDWQKGPWSLSGYLRGAYTRVETDAYTERMLANLPGQGLALVVDARSTRSTTSVLGGRATYILSRDWGILMPTASLEWEHEYQDDPGRLTARFLFDPEGAPLTQEGDDIDTDYFNVGIGLSALFPGGRSGFLTYEQLVGSDRLRQGILSLGVRIEF